MNDKILLIEDDLEISEMLKSYLTAENYEVTIRDRDSMEQIRLPISDLISYVAERIKFN